MNRLPVSPFLSSLQLRSGQIGSVNCFPIIDTKVGIPVNKVIKKENLSVPAFSESLKRYKFEDISNLELKGKI